MVNPSNGQEERVPSQHTQANERLEALRLAEEQFRRAIQDAPIPIIMQAEDGQVLQISRSWTELTGYSLTDLPTFDAWLHHAYGYGADAVRTHMHHLFAGVQQTLDVAFDIRTRTGEVRHWSFSASSPGSLRDGRRFVVGMAVDITEQTRTASTLAEQARLLDLSNDAIIIRDVTNRILYWNHGATEIYGWTRDEAIGRDLHTLLRTEFEIPFAQLLQQLHQHDRLEGEVVQQTRDGRRLTLLCRWALDRDQQGQPRAILTTYNDISERKRAEEALRASQERQAFLLHLSDALHELDDPIAVQATASRVLGEHLGVDRAYYAEIDEAKQEFVVAHDWHRPEAPSHARRYPLDDWLRPWLMDGQTWVVRDVASDPAMPDDQREAYRGNDIGACIVVPLIKANRLVATFVVNQQTARSWTSGDIALVEETAERLRAALERARAEAALRAEEAKYRTLFETIDEGFCLMELVFDEHGRIADIIYREANAAVETHAGLGDVVGKRASELFPRIEQHWLDSLTRVYQTGVPERTEGYNADTQRWFTLQYSRVGGAGSPLVAAVFNDITERKGRDANRQLLVDISADLSRLSNEEQIIQNVGAKLAAHIQLTCYHYVDVDEARAEVTIRHFWHAMDVPSILGTYPIDGFIPPHRLQSLRAGETSVVNDVQNDVSDHSAATAALKAGAAAQQIGAYVAVPYSQDGKWKAYVAVAHSSVRQWTSLEVELIGQVANLVFPRIERARAEAALRASEERQAFLLKLSDAMRQVADPAQTRTVAMDLLGELLGADQTFYYRAEQHENGWIHIVDDDYFRTSGMPTRRGERAQSEFGEALFAPLARGEAVIVTDIHAVDGLTPKQRENFQTANLRSFLVVPVVKNGRYIAGVSVQSSTPRAWTAFELALIQDVAERTWIAMERAWAEAALRESEAKYRTLFDTMAEGFAICGALRDAAGQVVDLRYLEVNRALEQQTGLDSQALMGRKLSEVLPPADLERWMSIYAGAIDNSEPVAFEEYVALLDRWFAVSVYPRTGDELVVLYRDITERKQAEERQAFLLKLSDALRVEPNADAVANRALQMLSEQLRLDRCWISEVFAQQEISTVGPEHLGSDLPPMVGVFPLSDYPETMQQLATQPMVIKDAANDPRFSPSEKALLAGLRLRALLVVPLRKGQRDVIWALAVAMTTPRHWTGGERVLLEEVAERTWAAVERARAEEALQRANEALEARVAERTNELAAANHTLRQEIAERKQLEAQRAALLERIITAQEGERQRIAYELHDTLGQLLSALNLRLSMAQGLDGILPTVRDELGQLQALTKRVDVEVDRLTMELRPPALEHLGLADALHSYAQEWTATSGVTVDVLLRGLDGIRLAPAVETTAYRIVQEALSNVLKHAQESAVSVIVERRARELRVLVEDDGVGFEPHQGGAQGTGGRQVGLLGMAERATLTGGELSIESSPGAGTTIYLHIPLGDDTRGSTRGGRE
jgi:PAS domain S-box-containing protein